MADYITRLVMRIPADTPGDAPVQFVRYLVEGGLIDWIYRVEDADTNEIIGYFDGNGHPVDMEALLAGEEEDEDGEIPTPVETLTLPDPAALAEPLEVTITTSATPTEEDDDELLALAESLNETEQL